LASCVRWGSVTRAIRAGDSSQFQILFDHFFQAVFREAKRLTGRDEATCLDIVQDTMLKVAYRIKVIDNEPQLAQWIRMVTRTTTYDWLRKELKRNPTTSLPPMDIADTGFPEAENVRMNDQARLLWIQEQLSELPPKTRQMINLKYRLGWSLKRIGQRFGLKTGAVDGRIRRAVEQLSKNAELEYHE